MCRKSTKLLLQPREISLVRAEMIVVDIGDDGDHRLQMHERGIALVGFGDQIAARAEARIAVGALQAAADHERRVEPALGEDARHQTRGGGLAVRARDRDGVAKAHELAQHLRARHDRDAVGERRRELGICAIDRARDHDHIRLAEMLGRMAEENSRAEAPEALGDGVGLEVRALDLVAEVEQHLGDASHAASRRCRRSG